MGKARDEFIRQQNEDMQDDWDNEDPKTRNPRGPKQIGKRWYPKGANPDDYLYQGDFDD